MASERYRLSPYCVVWMDADGRTAHLVHGLYGSRFDVAADLFGRLLGQPEGIAPDEIVAGAPPGFATAIATLVDEKVLIPVSDADIRAASDLFRDRLQPIELAFHRGLDEGGFFADDVHTTAIPPPAKPPRRTKTLKLASHAGSEDAPSLSNCLDRRRSSRAFGEAALPRDRFERFLELTCRAFALRDAPGLGWVSVRHYPSAGARYPLEIYPVVYRVDGIPEGIYHYRPFAHCLEAIPSERAHREALCDAACHRMATRDRPAVQLVVTAVFARTCWKYRGMPYHAILMETGALYQTMYLAATALDLASCAVGAFPERATAELLGVDARDEAQVGLFALGAGNSAQPSRMRIVALARDTTSPFADDAPGSAIELRFADGARHVVPRAELALVREPEGALRCRVGRRGDVADIEESCRGDALRLLGTP
jgi:SagB-type dehydrogenase family enzyme